MEMRLLPGTDLNVSRLSFGTMTFGKPSDQADATRLVERCLDAGINFFDTANMYQLGVAETMLGEALRGRRDKVVLASKVRFKMGDGPDQSGLSRAAIARAIDESLKRLQTDHVDLYYFHFPDWAVPIEESMEAMQRLVEAGKVRYPATSNYAGWQLTEMLFLARERKQKPALISQQMYNLIARGIEQEYLAMSKRFRLALIAYNPLAGGLLTGKHKIESVLPGTRFDNNKLYQDRYWHPQDFQAVARLQEIARASGRTLIGLSLCWLLHHTPTDSVILGASSMEQLEQNLKAAAEGPLPPDVLKSLDDVWQELRGPLPVYNR